MVDFGKSDKMIKISGKVDKPNTYNGFSSDISFFILGRTSSVTLNFISFFFCLYYTQECYGLLWTNSGSNTPQNNSCTAT